MDAKPCGVLAHDWSSTASVRLRLRLPIGTDPPAGRRAEDAGRGAYRAILVPKTAICRSATLEDLLGLASDGATVIFIDALPADVPGYGDLEERRTEFKSAIASLEFSAPGTDSVRTAVVGKGRVLLADSSDDFTAFARAVRGARGRHGARRPPPPDPRRGDLLLRESDRQTRRGLGRARPAGPGRASSMAPAAAGPACASLRTGAATGRGLPPAPAERVDLRPGLHRSARPGRGLALPGRLRRAGPDRPATGMSPSSTAARPAPGLRRQTSSLVDRPGRRGRAVRRHRPLRDPVRPAPKAKRPTTGA